MLNLTSPSTIINLMQRHGIKFSKDLGQNFIINPHICPRIAQLGGALPDVGAIEIGPGLGVLSRELAKSCKKVVSIEIDRSLLPVLEETLEGFDNIEIVSGDILKTDIGALIAQKLAGLEVIVCANLPYYITAPILMHLLKYRKQLKSITVMVQKEVAQRICATMPSRLASPLTAAIAYYAIPKIVMNVSPGSFMPAPKVDSAVINLEILKHPPIEVLDEEFFFKVIKAAFSQRRKMLPNCFEGNFGLQKADIAVLLEKAGVNPKSRAEQLSLEDFGRITSVFLAELK